MKRFVSMTALVASVGCGLQPAAVEETAQVEDLGSQGQEILNAAEVTSDTTGSLHLIKPGSGCSAVLLRSRWAMTTRHCLPVAGTSTVTTRAGATATVDNVYGLADPIGVTLVHFNADLAPEGNGLTRGPYPLYKGGASSLVNKTVLCQGWGASGGTPHLDINTGNWADYTYDGKLHAALFPIAQAPSTKPAGHPFADDYFATTSKVVRNASGQIQGPGDSGSGCITKPTSIQKTKWIGPMWFHEGHLPEDPFAYNTTGIYAQHHSLTNFFRDWANGITGTAPTLGLNAGYERSDGVSSVVYRNGSDMRELYNVSGTWGVGTLTSGIVASNPAMYVRPDGYNSVVFRDTNNHIRELALFEGGNWTLYDLSGAGGTPAVGDPSVFTRTYNEGVNQNVGDNKDNTTHPIVVYRTNGNRVQTLTLGSSGWLPTDLNTFSPEAPLAATDPIGYVRSDGVPAIVYTDSNLDIWEFSRPIGAAFWSAKNLSKTAVPQAGPAGGRVRPYTRSDGVTAIVFRNTTNNHINELSKNTNANTNWAAFDLGPTTASSPVGYVRGDGTNAVVYEAQDRSVHELALLSTGWTDFNLNTTGGLNAPLADTVAANGAPNAYVRADRASAVVYRSGGHLWELSLPFGAGAWSKKDMTQEAGGAL